MGSQTIINPQGAFGYTDLTTLMGATRYPFKTSAVVTAGNIVTVNTVGAVARAATDATPSLVVGQAVYGASTSGTVLVAVAGIAENCVADGAIAAGNLVTISANTSGAVAATATPTAGQVIGRAINASAGGTVDVWLSPSALS